jgi:hypothetical protein
LLDFKLDRKRKLGEGREQDIGERKREKSEAKLWRKGMHGTLLYEA